MRYNDRKPGRVLRLDDLRHRAMLVGQAPRAENAVRDLANIMQDLISEVGQLANETTNQSG